MIPVSIRLDEKHVEKLKGMARREAIRRKADVSYADLIRELVEDHVSKKPTKKPVSVIESMKEYMGKAAVDRAIARQGPIGDEINDDGAIGDVVNYFAERRD